jgi:hypothetical protein
MVFLLFYPHLLENHGKFMGFNGDLIGFHEILMGNSWDLNGMLKPHKNRTW